MANEAAVTLIMRMRDEASPEMKKFAGTTQTAALESFRFNLALSAIGGALTSLGALVGKADSPAAKLASTFLITGGAIFQTTAAIIHMIPYIQQMITWLRSLAVAQALVKALQGPIGLIGVGAAIGAAGAVAVVASQGSRSAGTSRPMTTSTRSSSGSSKVVIENKTILDGRQIGLSTRREIILDGDRNGTSGVK
jgi:hypothetical protein